MRVDRMSGRNRGSPAANAHIEQGGVLTAINGSPLMRSSDFAETISKSVMATDASHGDSGLGKMPEERVRSLSQQNQPELSMTRGQRENGNRGNRQSDEGLQRLSEKA